MICRWVGRRNAEPMPGPPVLLWLSLLLIVVGFGGEGVAWGQQSDQDSSASAVEPIESSNSTPVRHTASGRRCALIVVGLPGDEPHRERFAQTSDTWRRWLIEVGGFQQRDVTVLSSLDRNDSESLPTAERIAQVVSQLTESLGENDAFWLFLLGHGSQDARQAWFHLPGPDLDATKWSGLFSRVAASEQVYWLTQAGSGGFLKPMSLPGRIVITATDPNQEVNETRFPHLLASEMQEQMESVDLEANPNPIENVLQLFLATVQQVNDEFTSQQLVPTEHAQLDDSGDGMGTEWEALSPESIAQINDPQSPVDGVLAWRTTIPGFKRPDPPVTRPPSDNSNADESGSEP